MKTNIQRDVFDVVSIYLVIIAGSRKTHSNDIRQNIYTIMLKKTPRVIVQ